MSNNTHSESVFSNIDALRINPENGTFSGTREILTHVAVRKPNRWDFFRVHPGEEMSLVTSLYIDKEENE